VTTDPYGEDEQTGNDARQATHGVDNEPHRSRELAVYLVQVDGGEDSDRHRDDGRDRDLLERPDDRVLRTAARRERPDLAQVLDEEAPREFLEPFEGHVRDHPHENRGHEHSRGPHEHRHNAVDRRFGVGSVPREYVEQHDEGDVPPQRDTDRAAHVQCDAQKFGERRCADRGHRAVGHVRHRKALAPKRFVTIGYRLHHTHRTDHRGERVGVGLVLRGEVDLGTR
jgi:hypothetical protein